VLSDTQAGLITQKAMELNDIKDTTGAGDAFWTGFLYAGLQGYSLNDRITIAQRLATIKLQNVGRLPENIDIYSLLQV
jgi:fructokinase